MREYYLQLDEAVKAGLRRHHRNPRNVQAAVECHNLRVGESGLEAFESLTNPFNNLTYVWPFPQIIEATRFSFLILRNPIEMEDRIYSFVPGNWDLSYVFAVNAATFGQGSRFDIADFDAYVIMTNGVVMLRYDVESSSFVPFVSSPTIPLCETICDFKGQAVAGGVNSSWHSLGPNGVVWTKIGSMDFTPGRDNEAGFRNADSQVYRIRRLGDGVIVYGSKSLGRLNPVREPAPTFGWEEIAEFGICNKGAFDGGKHQHVFVSEDGWLWSLTVNGGLKKLGYQEYMKQMNLELVTVVHDKLKNDFYISDGKRSFLLTSRGLGSVHQCVGGLVYVDQQPYGAPIDTGDITARWVSDSVDMGYRALKTISVVEVSGTFPHSMQAGIYWRSRRQQSRFIRGPMMPVNDEGVAYPVVSGTEFRVALESSSYKDVELDAITLRWKMTDLRNIRGVYPPPPRGQ